MSFEILLPIAKRADLVITDQREAPWALRSYIAGAFGTGAIPIHEIGHIYGGRTARPIKPIMVMNQGVVSFIVGGGEAEAAELEDLAYAQTEKQTQRQRADHIGQLRHERGLPDRAQAPALISEALREHGRDRVANPSNYGKRPPPDRSWVRRLPDARTLPIWR